MNETCKNCGKPIHNTGQGCGTCNQDIWQHDHVIDTMRCPGSGHVRAA